MHIEDRLEQIQKSIDHLLAQNPGGVTEEEAAALPPERKVQLLKAMGFAPRRNRHAVDCLSIQGPGYICTCVIPQTVWRMPDDVTEFLGQTLEERKAQTLERIRKTDPEDADRRDDLLPKEK